MGILRRVELILGVLTAVLGLATLAFALGAPLGTSTRSCTTSQTIGQPPQVDCSQAGTWQVSLIQTQGLLSLLPAILIFSSILLAILGFSLTHRRSGSRASLTFLWIFTALLWVMMVLAGFSIGLFFFPTAVLALVTAILASIAGTRRQPMPSPAAG